MEKTLYEKLSFIQTELKAPKSQYNSFGKYKYRNCEDILESAKPICHKNRTTLIIRDEITVFNERYYVKAIATLIDWDSENKIEICAYAREEENKKGMDASQVTGATSSYARKYALNGLFNIDDTKDTDTTEYQTQNKSSNKQDDPNEKETLIKEIMSFYQTHKKFGSVLKETLQKAGKKEVSSLDIDTLRELVEIARTSAKSFE